MTDSACASYQHLRNCRSKSRITSPQAVSRHWLPDTARWSVHPTLYQVHLLSSVLLSPGSWSWSWSGKDGLLTPLPVYHSIVKWLKIICVCFTIIPYNHGQSFCLFTINIFFITPVVMSVRLAREVTSWYVQLWSLLAIGRGHSRATLRSEPTTR